MLTIPDGVTLWTDKGQLLEIKGDETIGLADRTHGALPKSASLIVRGGLNDAVRLIRHLHAAGWNKVTYRSDNNADTR